MQLRTASLIEMAKNDLPGKAAVHQATSKLSRQALTVFWLGALGCQNQTCLDGLEAARACLETTGMEAEYGHIARPDDCSTSVFGGDDRGPNPRDWVFVCVDTSSAAECVEAFEAFEAFEAYEVGAEQDTTACSE